MFNRLAAPEDQDQYHRGYKAFNDGIDKNPFEYMSERMRPHKIYWQMGWDKAKKDNLNENQTNSLI